MGSPEDTILSRRELVDDFRLRLIVRSCVRCTSAQTPGFAGACLELMELSLGRIYYVHCYSYLLEATVGRMNGFGVVKPRIIPIELFSLALSKKAYETRAQSHVLDHRAGCTPINQYSISARELIDKEIRKAPID